MEAFVEERNARFMLGSRVAVLDELLAHAIGTVGNGYLCLTGAPGSGKTALLAHLSRHPALSDQPSTVLIRHFVGTSSGSTDVRRTLRRLCHELKAGCPDITGDIPDDPDKLRVAFPEFLRQASAKKRVVILLDALNQFDRASHSTGLSWLPDELPANARIILSALDGQELDELRLRRMPPRETELHPLTAADGEAIIEQFRKRYRKQFEPGQRAALLAKTDAGKPLYLVTALEELRTLGNYEEINQRIAELPPTIDELFVWILERLENDDGFCDAAGRQVGRELVSSFSALLGASRFGLSQRELTDLPDAGDPQGNVAALLRILRPYLMHRRELLDFYHGQCREAAQTRYLETDDQRTASHRALAEYFGGRWSKPETHALRELPHHYIQGQLWPEIVSTLCNVWFINIKCSSAMAYELHADFQAALTALPGGDGRSRVVDFSKAYSQEMRDLISFANHGGDMPFADFVFQQMRNRILRNTEGRLELAGETRFFDRMVLLHLRPSKRSLFMRRVEADVGSTALRYFGTVRFSPDGGMLFVAVNRHKVLCIDPESGREFFALQCEGRAAALDFSPNGNQLVVGGDMGADTAGGFVQVFDLRSSHSQALLQLEVPAYKLVVTANNEVFVAACDLVHVIDLDTLQIKRKWAPYDNHLVYAIAVNKHRNLLATGEFHDEDRPARISIWDAHTMALLAEMQGPKWGITSLAFSDWEGVLVSGSCHLNNGVVAWDWRCSGTTIDQMFLSPQQRHQAFELSRRSHEQRLESQVISVLETKDSVAGIVFFPQSSWIVAVEGSPRQASDAINVFNIYGNKPSSVGNLCDHPAVPIAVDIDCRGRWMATLHAQGHVVIWPADGLKEIKPQAPPTILSEHFTDRACRYVLSIEDDPHRYIHITNTETGDNILSSYQIPCHKAGLFPQGNYFVRFYWSELPVNPYIGSDGSDESAQQWFKHFLSTTPVRCTLHSIEQFVVSHHRTKELPGYAFVDNLDLEGEVSKTWIFSPKVEALNICFSRDGAWGAAIVGSQEMPAHIFCFSPVTGESRMRTIPKEIQSGFLVFDNDGSLCLVGVADNNKVIAYFDITEAYNQDYTRIYRGFGVAEKTRIGPLPIGRNRFVCVREENQLLLFEPIKQQSEIYENFPNVTEIGTLRHSSGIVAVTASRDGNLLVVSDVYPSISVFQLPSFRLVLWHPMDQVSTDVCLDDTETRLLAIGKFRDLDGLHYSLMEFSALPKR